MDIKTMLEEIAPEIDELAAHDQIMALVRRRRRGVWVARVAVAAAVVAGFVAVAMMSGPGLDPVPPANGSSTSATDAPPTTATSIAPTVSAAPTAPPPTTVTAAPSETAAPTTTSVTTTTTVPSSTTIPIVEPIVIRSGQLAEYSVIVQESTSQGPIVPVGTDDGDGDGCTPGVTDSLPDGLWYVHDLNPLLSDGVALLEFDLVCRYSDDERQAIYTPDEVLYDTSVRNDSGLLRTIPFAADARLVVILGGNLDWHVWDDALSFAVVEPRGLLYGWLKVVDGEIVEVFQEFMA